MRTFVRLILPLVPVAAVHPAVADVYSYRLVAQTGDAAPGSLGGSFTDFGSPFINASGQIAFMAHSDGLISETGMWRTVFDDPQSLSLVVGQDYPVPGAPQGVHFGVFDTSLHHALLNDDGNVGFSAPVLIGDEFSGLFRMIDGVVTKVAIETDAAPGLPSGTTFSYVSNLEAFNAHDIMAFRVRLEGPGVGPTNDDAFFMTWFGGITMVAREGFAAPGLPGTTFGGMTVHAPLLSDDSQIAFDVPLNGAEACAWSRWRGWPGGLSLLAKEGDATPIGGVFGGESNDFWSMSLPAEGACFIEPAVLDVGLAPGAWRVTDELEPIAVAGQLGPLGFYEDIDDTAGISAALDGTTTFVARFSWFGLPDDADTAVLRQVPGEPAEVVLREGDPAYGFGAGVEIDDLVGLLVVTQTQITDSRWLFVHAKVRGPGINQTNSRGYWAIDPEGEVHFIARYGQWVSFEGEPARQLSSITLINGYGPNSGRRGGVNERGDAALRFGFTNGDSAVVVAQLGPDCVGDLSGNGVVNAEDLALMLGAWGTTGPVGTGGDVDWDGDSDGEDLALLLGAWGPCGR